jgi:2-polyprenyl-3-methyl-5-hydroxy-6-metoxy-1,4-benzoquinol methylase
MKEAHSKNTVPDRPKGLSAALYDEFYYRHSLPGMEHLNDPNVIDEAGSDTIEVGAIKAGQNVLDFGCGRGACAIVLAQHGCHVLGVDYSSSAIKFANNFRTRFPSEIQEKVTFQKVTSEELEFKNKFDVIVFNQVYEHLYDWELETLFLKFKTALKKTGALVISTPNLDYVRFLYPLKRLTNLPFKILKETARVFRGTSKHATSFHKFLKEIFKIQYPKSEHTRLHINLQTPRSIQTFLSKQGFDVKVKCIDRHKNLLSLATERWWGETIWVCARKSAP